MINDIRKRFHLVQNDYEITELQKMVASLNPKYIVEIGVENGGTLQIWCNSIVGDGYVVGVDIQDKVNWDIFDKNDKFLYYVQGDSKDEKTINSVVSFIDSTENKNIDFLFIDGDHSYEGVKADFENYKGMVRSGGLIAFHDIYDGAGVAKFWKELQGDKSEIRGNKNPIGIGVYYV